MQKVIEKSEKYQNIFRRRTKVLELCYIYGYRKNRVASILGVNKSTITRDVEFLNVNLKQFLEYLDAYQEDFNKVIHDDAYKRNTIYDEQTKMLNWLESAANVLDHYKELMKEESTELLF